MKVVLDGGEVIDLGVTEATPTIGIVDYSRRETDDYGVTTVVERGFARRMSVNLIVPFDQTDALQRTLAKLRATPAQWVADDRFAWLNFRGFYKDFEIDLAIPPVSYCTLTVEALVATEVVADPGGDPAPVGQLSSLQLLQPAIVDDDTLAASTVAENDYLQWSASTTYALGDRVIRAGTHRIFESAAQNNTGNEPEGISGKWRDIGPTNRWAMFDQALGSVTTAAGSITVLLDAGAIDGIALLDVVGSAVRVQAAGYDRTAAPNESGTVTFLDLTGLAGPISVAITGPGTVEVGTLLVGPLVALGQTTDSPKAGITDFSRKEADEFGDIQVVERAWAKRMTLQAKIRTDAIDLVANRIASVRAKPSLWIGKEGMETLTIYGFFKDFSIARDTMVSDLSLSIEGLSTAGKVDPLSASVDWPDVGDSEGTKPEDNATVGAPAGTDVAGKPAEEVVSQLETQDTKLAALEVAAAQAVIDIAAAMAAAEQAQADVAAAVTQINGDIAVINAEAATMQAALEHAQSDITHQGDEILAAQADILANGGDIATLQTIQGTQAAQIGTLQTTADNQAGQLATLSTTVTAHGASIAQNATAITNVQGSVATLSSTVSTQGASITANANAITTLQGSVSTLQTTVTTQGASITALQTASSSLAGQLASLTTVVSAGGGLMNLNADFNNWPTGQTLPTNWAQTSGTINKVAGETRPTAVQGVMPAGSDIVLLRQRATPNAPWTVNVGNWIVMEADIRLDAGSLEACACVVSGVGTANGLLRFALDPDSNNVVRGAGVVGTIYRYRKLVQLVSGASTANDFYFGHFVSQGSVATATTITFFRVGWRPASQPEIDAGRVVGIEANVSTLQSASSTQASQIATLQTTVSTQGGSITANANAITTLQGTVTSLSTTVSTQGASITSLQTASTTQAGDIATLKTQVVAGGGNLVTDSEFTGGTAGWPSLTSGAYPMVFTRYQGGQVGSTKAPANCNVIEISQTTGDSAGYGEIGQWTSVEAGKYYDPSAYWACTGCNMQLYFQFWNDTAVVSSPASVILNGKTGGQFIGNWGRAGFAAPLLAPPTATRARLILRKHFTNAGAGTSTGWWMRPQVKETTVTSATPQPYAPSNSTATVESQATTLATTNSTLASLSTTVSTQGASITTMQTSITTLTTNLATLTTQVTSGNKNLIVNGGPENGTTGWTASGGTMSVNASGSGPLLQLTSTAATSLINSTAFSAAANTTYTATCNSYLTGPTGSTLSLSLIWLNSSGTEISRSSVRRPIHTAYNPTQPNRLANIITATAPAGTVTALFQAQISNASVGTAALILIGQVKVEVGTVATAYSNEASVTQSFTSISTLNTQYASLSTTVATQGVTITSQQTAITTINNNITTIFGQYVLNVTAGGLVAGIKLANNGSASSLRFQSDVVTFESSSGTGERTEYSNGNWRVYNSAGTLKVQWGVNI
ncbi:hypothetical protein WBP07_12865 [Novosphingobium sp. BL-8A]|uniref:beta strand repeat-containing protein n=1 Tax=Novosphingobium sp. BL-8A TaxID=3127639 RepID=UPI0037581A56